MLESRGKPYAACGHTHKQLMQRLPELTEEQREAADLKFPEGEYIYTSFPRYPSPRGLMVPLRVSSADEDLGLDVVLHGEVGYELEPANGRPPAYATRDEAAK